MDEIDLHEMRSASMTEAELEAHIASMTTAEKQHFKLLICTLARCYGEKPEFQGLVLLGIPEKAACSVLSLNCEEMEGAKMLQAATDFFSFINTQDAPPKEMFN